MYGLEDARAPLSERMPAGRAVTTGLRTRIGILVWDGFDAFEYGQVLEAFSAANQVLTDCFYPCSTVSVTGGPVTSRSGIAVSTTPLSGLENVGLLVVVGARMPAETGLTDAIGPDIRRLERAGSEVVFLASSVFHALRLGLLTGRACSLPRQYWSHLMELYPEVHLNDTLLSRAGRVVTAVGGASTLDTMVYLLSVRHGKKLEERLSTIFQRNEWRSPREAQSGGGVAVAGAGAAVMKAMDLMQRHIESPIEISVLAAQVGMSQRQLERRFRTVTGQTPWQYCRGIRLKRAWDLLEQTDLPIAQVCYACGFQSQSYFSRIFKVEFGINPGGVRSALRCAV